MAKVKIEIPLKEEKWTKVSHIISSYNLIQLEKKLNFFCTYNLTIKSERFAFSQDYQSLLDTINNKLNLSQRRDLQYLKNAIVEIKHTKVTNYRFNEMEVLRVKMQTQIRNLELFMLRMGYYEKDIKDILNLLIKKLSKPTKRSLFTKFAYEYIVECAEKQNMKVSSIEKLPKSFFYEELPFIVELTMTIQYHQNHDLDGKYDMTNKKQRERNTLNGSSLRELLIDYVTERYADTPIVALLVTKYMSKIIAHVNCGQKLERDCANSNSYLKNKIPLHSLSTPKDLNIIRDIIENVKEVCPDKSNYIDAYFQKLYLSCGALFTLTIQLIVEIVQCDTKSKQQQKLYDLEIENLLNFSRSYGIMLQLVNDITDWVKVDEPTTMKKEGDVFSDWRNNNVTLPLMYYMKYIELSQNYQKELIYSNRTELSKKVNVKTWLLANHKQITEEMVMCKISSQKGSSPIFAAMKTARQLSSVARNCLDGQNSQTLQLENLLNIAYNNRYFTAIFQVRNYCKQKLNQKEKTKQGQLSRIQRINLKLEQAA